MLSGQHLSSRHVCSWGYFTLSLFLSLLSFNLCFIHLLPPSHTSPPSTQETPNSITAGQQWEADSAAQVQLEGNSDMQHVEHIHHGSDFTAGRATALTENRARVKSNNF